MSESIVEGQDVVVPDNPQEVAEVIPNAEPLANLGDEVAGVAGEYQEPITYLHDMFTYHPPHPSHLPIYHMLRESAENFARVIERYVPRCADRTAAIRKIREAVMTANAAVALKGKV